MTPLDQAHIRAETDGTDTARLAFFNALAEAELHLLLDAEDGETVAPTIAPVDGVDYALAFDLPDRLTAFAGVAAATATLSGRRLAALLAAEGLGLALNLDEAPSAQLLPPDAIAWLAETLARAPAETEARIAEIAPPGALPENLITALDGKLSLAAGLAAQAYLARATYADGTRGHVLAFIDPLPGAEADLARAVSEALVFSGLEAGQIDVTFLRAAQTHAASLARHGLRIDLPKPPEPPRQMAPGTGDAPPRLR
ncbi:SseB family protein [Jannaschia pohangensis]|uniref:SseB protein N-terminal domain-containing protein n=1 Tax=Jannaschia pohangensis TaxID=390807 RepID=A0A1I3S9D5_9RHOB|nr:SseB family protein [Jannaschia pohangensis]SFJ55424.1 SseB protein N-terminal domain-containing protein [Jannaschia pohangensis]